MKPNRIDTAIIMLNWNGEKLLQECLDSLKKQSYKNFKLIIVDNGSTDGSQSLIKEIYPSATIIQNKKNLGFAEPNNQGIRRAFKDPKIKYIVTLNNDTVADKNWLKYLHDYLETHSEIGAAQGQILQMANKRAIDSAGILLTDDFLAYDIGHGKPKDYFRTGPILGPSAGAAIYRRELLKDIQQGRDFFDRHFFAYFEDVDLALRAHLRGWKSIFLKDALIYHVGSATMGQESPSKMYYLSRNRYWFILKNFGKYAAFSLLDELKRYYGDLITMYRRTDRESVADAMEKGFADSLKHAGIFNLKGVRNRALYKKRGGQHSDIFSIQPPHPRGENMKYKHKKVLIVSPDVVGSSMAGPGIRYFHLASELSKFFKVTLATPNDADLLDGEFKIRPYKGRGNRRLRAMIRDNDYIFSQSLNSDVVFFAMRQKKILIYDFYNPMPVEFLGSLQFSTQKIAPSADKSFAELLEHYKIYMQSGSYFVCSNTRQRDYWVGMLTANKVIWPTNVGKKNIESFVGLVPFGYSPNPPIHTKDVIKGKIKGIKKDDFVITWAGGIWNWFDPLSLIKAMKQIKDPKIKLLFLGTTHPNNLVGKQSMAYRAIDLAKKLKLIDKKVFFLHGWIKYDERANYLLESDAAVSTHFNTLETRFSFRTRVLDHYWAKLPSIVTRGDSLAEHIEENNLGISVNYEDVEGIAAAINKIKQNGKMRDEMVKNIMVARESYSWPNVAKDLINYIKKASYENSKNEISFPLRYQIRHSLPAKALRKYGPIRIWKSALTYFFGSYD